MQPYRELANYIAVPEIDWTGDQAEIYVSGLLRAIFSENRSSNLRVFINENRKFYDTESWAQLDRVDNRGLDAIATLLREDYAEMNLEEL